MNWAFEYNDMTDTKPSTKCLFLIEDKPCSSLIKGVAYDFVSRALVLLLDKDRVCRYQDVPPYVVMGMLGAESKGRFFLDHIGWDGFGCEPLQKADYEEICRKYRNDGIDASALPSLDDQLKVKFDERIKDFFWNFDLMERMIHRIHGFLFDKALGSFRARYEFLTMSISVAQYMRWAEMEKLNLEKRLRLIKGDNTSEVASTDELCKVDAQREMFACILRDFGYDDEVSRCAVSQMFGESYLSGFDEFLHERCVVASKS